MKLKQMWRQDNSLLKSRKATGTACNGRCLKPIGHPKKLLQLISGPLDLKCLLVGEHLAL